jgi:hypothetical protein
MTRAAITLITDSGTHPVHYADSEGNNLWLSEADLARTTGFELKPEGLCRDDACFPIPRAREAEFARPGEINVAAFWRYRGGPVLASGDRHVWLLGEPPAERAARLQSLEAPDFTLPDAAGRLHSLSNYRGRKVFLATWASW